MSLIAAGRAGSWNTRLTLPPPHDRSIAEMACLWSPFAPPQVVLQLLHPRARYTRRRESGCSPWCYDEHLVLMVTQALCFYRRENMAKGIIGGPIDDED